jgi:hypothetical protein
MDYRFSGFNHWGYKAGCAFVGARGEMNDTLVQRFGCDHEKGSAQGGQELLCTVDLASKGTCQAGVSHDGFGRVTVRSISHMKGLV